MKISNEIRETKVAALYNSLTFELNGVPVEDVDWVHQEITAHMQRVICTVWRKHGGVEKFLRKKLGPYFDPAPTAGDEQST